MSGKPKTEGGLFDKQELGTAIDELEAEKRKFDFVASALEGVFGQIDRALTMMRVYPKNHPLVDSLVDQVILKFDPIFEVEDDVVVRVDAMQLTSEWGHVVAEQNSVEKKEFIWYGAYADGIIQFEFHKGLEGDELQKLLWLINNSALGKISTDDDSVTLLWELNLEKIKYFAVEGFVDGGTLDDFDGRTEPEATALIADAAEDRNLREDLSNLFSDLNEIHVDLFTRMQVEAQTKIPEIEMRDKDVEYTFQVSGTALKQVLDEWDSTADLEYRLIEALLGVIRAAPASEGAKKAGDIIISVTHQLIDREMWGGAVKVMKLLDSRRSELAERGFDPVDHVLTELSDPVRLDALLNGFQKNGLQREGLRELLLLLDHDGVQKQIIQILSDANRKIVGLKWLFLLLKDVTNDTNSPNIYDAKTVKKGAYLERLLSQLEGSEHKTWQPVARILLQAIQSQKSETLTSALKVEHSFWRDPKIAEKHIMGLATHKEQDLRKMALKILSKNHKDIFAKTIKQNVMSKDFSGRSKGEVRFLMRTFMDTTPDATSELRKLIKTRGWGGQDGRDFAMIAAGILLKASDDEARKIVKAYSGSMLTHAGLKKDYSSLLKKYTEKNGG